MCYLQSPVFINLSRFAGSFLNLVVIVVVCTTIANGFKVGLLNISSRRITGPTWFSVRRPQPHIRIQTKTHRSVGPLPSLVVPSKERKWPIRVCVHEVLRFGKISLIISADIIVIITSVTGIDTTHPQRV